MRTQLTEPQDYLRTRAEEDSELSMKIDLLEAEMAFEEYEPTDDELCAMFEMEVSR